MTNNTVNAVKITINRKSSTINIKNISWNYHLMLLLSNENLKRIKNYNINDVLIDAIYNKDLDFIKKLFKFKMIEESDFNYFKLFTSYKLRKILNIKYFKKYKKIFKYLIYKNILPYDDSALLEDKFDYEGNAYNFTHWCMYKNPPLFELITKYCADESESESESDDDLNQNNYALQSINKIQHINPSKETIIYLIKNNRVRYFNYIIKKKNRSVYRYIYKLYFANKFILYKSKTRKIKYYDRNIMNLIYLYF